MHIPAFDERSHKVDNVGCVAGFAVTLTWANPEDEICDVYTWSDVVGFLLLSFGKKPRKVSREMRYVHKNEFCSVESGSFFLN